MSSSGVESKDFQSNQSGIETKNISDLNSNWEFFQSNQSGIETTKIAAPDSKINPFQSNQSGIETNYDLLRNMSCALPIEPKWN